MSNCSCRSKGAREGLYILIFFILMYSCDTSDKIREIETNQQRIEKKLDSLLMYKNKF